MLFVKILFVVAWMADIFITGLRWSKIKNRGFYATQTRAGAIISNAVTNAIVLLIVYYLITFFK